MGYDINTLVLFFFSFFFFSLSACVCFKTTLIVLTATTKKIASGPLPIEGDNRRKRRKVECPLPSPPDLKISDYEPPRKSTPLPLIEDNIKKKESSLDQQYSIIHDLNYCMFKIQLDKKGNTGIILSIIIKEILD